MFTAIQTISQHRSFGGRIGYYSHQSAVTDSIMRFAVYQPPRALRGRVVPVIYFLPGLTCTEETFVIKGGALRYASEAGLMLVTCDSSPRGCHLPGESDDWEVGAGAGYYVDATEGPWSAHYRMFSYVSHELPEVIAANFPARSDRQGIFGHSVGGHGALVIGLSMPERFDSISAFAPMVAPMRAPWGEKAFRTFLGSDPATWESYDASMLVRRTANAQKRAPILIDQGMADQFIDVQLHPHIFELACHDTGYPLSLRRHEGYDHGYFFVSTFMADHIKHHATRLLGPDA